MRILILGGTVFLGRALVDEALQRGHQLTLFNRGQTNPGLYPQVERLIGDRKVDLSALKGSRWEAVIDTSGYLPRVVAASAAVLATLSSIIPLSPQNPYMPARSNLASMSRRRWVFCRIRASKKSPVRLTAR